MGTYVTYPYLEYHRYRVQVLRRVVSRLHQRQESHYLVTYMFPVGCPRYPSWVASSGLARDFSHLFPQYVAINSLTNIRVLVGTKNSRPVGFYSRNSMKSTVNPNTTIHKYDHHGGAVCHSYGVGSMDPPNRTRRPSSEGVGRGDGGRDLVESIN